MTSSHILLAAVLTLLGSPCAAIAASPRAPLSPSSGTLSSYLVTAPKAAVLNRLAAQFEIENKSGTVYEIIVPSEKTAELLRIAPSASLLEPDLGAAARALRTAPVRR